MSMIDRKLITGERQATWWCGFCFGKGTWVSIGSTEDDRRHAAELVQTRYDAHRCPRRQHFEHRHRVRLRRHTL